MSWMLSIWVAAALLALCKGQNTVHEGNSLSASGYHLCINNETRNVSFLVVHTVSDTVTKKCGDWLLWRTCTVTVYKMTYKTEYKTVTEQVTRCCNGYEQVGRYCALPVNRSVEFTAKPGSCPTADGLHPRYEDCEWDIDCPGQLKCCQTLRGFLCIDPASSANYSENGGCRFNATVTVKTDYQQLMSSERGHLNHIRLLQAMVTGALQSDVSVYYLSSQPVHPYRSATSLLIESNCTLSLYNVTSKLHLLLKHIQEVSSVTVEDIDECAEPALRQCSPHADCNNTMGSYHCACRQGYIDVDPNNPGAHCTADVMVATTTEPPFTYLPPMTTTCPPAFTTETSMTTALSNTSPVPYNNSSHAPQWTTSAPYSSMSSTVESPLPTTTCSPPSITSVWAANVTGTSFCVYWSSHFQTNQTYQVVLSKGSEVTQSWGTSQTMLEVRNLQPGVLYNVTVTPQSCGGQGVALQISVKTDAQTLDVTVRLTNIEFTADLHNTSSQAYENLTESIRAEIYQSLSPEIKALMDSGQVRIQIRGLSPGSVVVIFSIISTPSQSQDISNVSTAVLNSLINITKYTVDRNSTSTTDFNECASGENDCSLSATCTNTWASYTCVCQDGFIDNNPERPGRACQAIATTTTAPTTTTTALTTTMTPPTTTMTAPTTTTTALTTTATAPTTIMTAPTTTAAPTIMAAPTSTMTATATTISAPTTIAASAVTATAPTTTITVTTTTATAPTTTTAPTITAAPAITTTASPTATTALTTTTAAPTTTTTASTITAAPATITTASTTITAAPTTTTTASTITAAPTTTTSPTTTTAALTTTTSPTTTTAAPTTTTTASTITAAPAIITTASTTITAAPTATTSPTTTTVAPTTATAATTSAPITTATAPTTTTTVPTTTTTSTITTIPTTTTTTSTTTTSTAMIPMTSTPTTTLTIPTTTITSPTTSGSAVRTATTAISVQCRLAAITVTIHRDFLQNNNIRESTLYLGLPECGVNGGNATHAQLTVAWNECGTSLVHNDTYYTTSVTLFNSMDMYTSSSGAVEVPRKRLEVPIMCTYMKSMLISADFGSMGYDMIQDLIMGSGSFQVTVQLMNGTMPLPHNYSLSSKETVVVEVSVNTSSDQIKVVINKCWATPTQNPADTPSETFLENSCSLNQYTTVLMNGNSSTSRVSVQIFSVVDMDVIYLHCQVQICVEIGSDTCVPDCLQRTSRSSHTIGSTLRTYGPVWRSGEDSLEEGYTTLHIVGLSCLGIGLSLLFIIGFLCLFYYQRNRIGNYNFNAKPKQENFTYLVFNT